MPLLPTRKLPEVSSIGQVRWCFMALGGIWKAFQVFFFANMFTGMSSQILGEKFAIYRNIVWINNRPIWGFPWLGITWHLKSLQLRAAHLIHHLPRNWETIFIGYCCLLHKMISFGYQTWSSFQLMNVIFPVVPLFYRTVISFIKPLHVLLKKRSIN